MNDLAYMRAALGLARRGLGQVAPNPAVGCVIVKDGCVVGRGWTQAGGRPHAETEALARAGALAQGATAYVTLEPCAHHGKTPPCAEALIASGIARVVAALEDPDPRVSGRGLARLRQARIAVTLGVAAAEAETVAAPFLMRVREGRPRVTLKLATSVDGRIATHRGDSQWITGEASRAYAHGLRRRHDAVMVGSGTALADDPMLNVRLPGVAGAQPLRIVVDGRLRTPLTAKLVATAQAIPTLIVTRPDADPLRLKAFRDCGVKTLIVPAHPETGAVDPKVMMLELGSLGLTSILVEGGAVLAAGLLRARRVDEIAWFRSAGLIGADGTAALAPLGVDLLSEQPCFRRLDMARLGDDLLETFIRAD